MTERQEIFVLGFPRSGNSWLSRLLGHVLNCPIESGKEFPSNADEGHDRPGPFVIRLRHPDGLFDPSNRDRGLGNFIGKSVAQIVRDPRDVLLSLREYYKSTWIDALIRMESWSSAIEACSEIGVRIRYEDLHQRTARELGRILVFLDLSFDPHAVREAVWRQSWSVRINNITEDMPYGPDHQRLAFGHGKVGRWRQEMPKDVLQEGLKIFGGTMRDLGYVNA